MTRAIVVMGVSGSGKSTVAEALAERLGMAFLEGDAFHPAANVWKMATGIALDDRDRWPWLDAVGAAIAVENAKRGVVAACSALKRDYRDRLRRAVERPMVFIYLSADRDELARRLQARQGHFMSATLLQSQLATLQEPQDDEPDVIWIASGDIEGTLQRALQALSSRATTCTVQAS